MPCPMHGSKSFTPLSKILVLNLVACCQVITVARCGTAACQISSTISGPNRATYLSAPQFSHLNYYSGNKPIVTIIVFLSPSRNINMGALVPGFKGSIISSKSPEDMIFFLQLQELQPQRHSRRPQQQNPDGQADGLWVSQPRTLPNGDLLPLRRTGFVSSVGGIIPMSTITHKMLGSPTRTPEAAKK